MFMNTCYLFHVTHPLQERKDSAIFPTYVYSSLSPLSLLLKKDFEMQKVPNSGPGGGDVTQRHTASPLGLQVPLEVTSLIPPPPGQEPYQAHPRLYAHDHTSKGARGLGFISLR